VPVLIFGFMDTMYLAQEKAYRDLHKDIAGAIQNKWYAIGRIYEASASIGFARFLSAFGSWSVFPVYLGLLLLYFIARWTGWITVLATAAR